MIRQASKPDIKIIAGLAVLLWDDNSIEDLANEFAALMQRDNACCAQCELRSDYVEGTETSPVGYLEGIFVLENYRNKGYAKELLYACEAWAKEKGCKEFASDCELDNTDSFRFHMAMQFTEANRIICFTKKL